MKNLSVSTFIHILFSVTIAILIATFLLFLSWDKDRQKIQEYKRYQLISITFLSKLKHNTSQEELEAIYDDLKVKEINIEKIADLKRTIEREGKTVFTGGSSLGKVRVFNVAGQHYIYIQRMAHHLMLIDNRPENYYFEIAMALGAFLIALLLLIYLAVLKKIYPLRTLHRQIQKFAQGDLSVRVSYSYDDEIGKIAKSFDDAIVHINELITSKNLFMRNLMHELKTPLTKGRIVVEMLDDESTKKVLVNAFDRMNALISELAELERVSTQSFEPYFEYVLLSEILQESQELLMTQSACIETDIEDMALTTDKKLMTLVIKNLMDNGLKYGTDKCAKVQNSGKIIEVISKGEALAHPLTYYTEPFSQGEKRSAGFGLGLYIVSAILEKIEYSLDYHHDEGKNVFMLLPK